MLGRIILGVSIILALSGNFPNSSGATPSNNLVVRIQPANGIGIVFLTDDTGNCRYPLSLVTGGIFKRSLSDLPVNEAFENYDVVIRNQNDTDDLSDLALSITPVHIRAKTFIDVQVYLSNPAPNQSTILRFAKRGLKRERAYQTYFESRNIFKKLKFRSPNHPVTAGAAYWYFASAFVIAGRLDNVIPIDNEALVAARVLINRAENDARFKTQVTERLKIRLNPLKTMLDKASRLEWTSYALIRKAVKSGDLSSALILAKFFQQKFAVMQKKEQLKVQAEYRVDSKLIDNDVKYIQTRLRGFSNPVTPVQNDC